ncbi:MAG: ABC transporter permease, partial [Chryseobacterium sp.]|nr:ABC transporter permease [Chryseobacterium sp.]
MEPKTENLINIHNFLPHREPMLMTDYILELTEDKVITSFKITQDNIFVHNNEFVEAGLIENLAQTCSSILGQSFFENPDADTKVIGFITNIKKIE